MSFKIPRNPDTAMMLAFLTGSQCFFPGRGYNMIPRNALPYTVQVSHGWLRIRHKRA